MDLREKIVLIRNILNNACNMSTNPEIVLKISKEIDKYIVEYLRKNEGKLAGNNEESFERKISL